MKSTSASFQRSSAAYEAALVPARRPRFLLLASAAVATVAGTLLILLLPAPPLLELVTALLWVASGILELSRLSRGMARTDRIFISADGTVRGQDARGRFSRLRLLAGSIVLDRVAWLRLGFDDGLACGELLFRSSRESDAWRRLQVMWRLGRAFGRSGRS